MFRRLFCFLDPDPIKIFPAAYHFFSTKVGSGKKKFPYHLIRNALMLMMLQPCTPRGAAPPVGPVCPPQPSTQD